MENSQELERNEVVNINYTQPKFWHRVMANFIDFFLFILHFFLLFLLARTIVLTTPDYQAAETTIANAQIDSGLYIMDHLDDDKIVDVITYIDRYTQVYGSEFDGVSEDGGKPTGKNGQAVYAINKFIDYTNKPEVSTHDELVSYYDEIRLETVTSDGIHFYIKDGDNIVINETLASDPEKRKLYYVEIYTPFIEKRCLPFLTTNVPEYRNAYRVEFNYLVFIELPISYILAAILVYYVPPLFFRRGRKTLGKAIYHIGLIDDRVLSPTLARFTARFAILLFGELILSLFTFGIPYIISFSIMTFSKSRQGFPDYMLHLYEIDTSRANIYLDYVEAELKNELHGEAIDFRMEKPL